VAPGWSGCGELGYLLSVVVVGDGVGKDKGPWGSPTGSGDRPATRRSAPAAAPSQVRHRWMPKAAATLAAERLSCDQVGRVSRSTATRWPRGSRLAGLGPRSHPGATGCARTVTPPAASAPTRGHTQTPGEGPAPLLHITGATGPSGDLQAPGFWSRPVTRHLRRLGLVLVQGCVGGGDARRRAMVQRAMCIERRRWLA
jgi:hypothetical protein